MRELSIWRVRVASLTRLATRHKKTRIDARQSREYSRHADMPEPGKNRDQIAKIMSSAKRDRSPSVELVYTESPDEKNSEEDECTESEQELSTSQNEPQSRQTSAIQHHVNKQQSKQSVCHARKELFIEILEVEVRISGSQNLLAIGFQCPGFQLEADSLVDDEAFLEFVYKLLKSSI